VHSGAERASDFHIPLARILISTWFSPGSGILTSFTSQLLFAEGTIAAFTLSPLIAIPFALQTKIKSCAH
jgi:hypothetical protein